MLEVSRLGRDHLAEQVRHAVDRPHVRRHIEREPQVVEGLFVDVGLRAPRVVPPRAIDGSARRAPAVGPKCTQSQITVGDRSLGTRLA